MKKLFVLGALILFIHPLFAQLEITPYNGWLWTGSVPMYNYPPYYSSQNARVNDRANYGIRAGYRLPSDLILEFEWNHTETDFIYRQFAGEKASIPLSANYYWLGGVREFKTGPVVPFGIFNLGMVNFKAIKSGDNTTMFAVGMGGGVKYFLSDKFGIRLQARLISPMQFAGVSLGCGIGSGGGGCGSGVNTYSAIIQGDFTGGVILKLGE
ncbi:MAG: porin family protein [Cyclobacteriaceae bacterium]|nr:porin family protein [Cyclobacteriaceae bacterium]